MTETNLPAGFTNESVEKTDEIQADTVKTAAFENHYEIIPATLRLSGNKTIALEDAEESRARVQATVLLHLPC